MRNDPFIQHWPPIGKRRLSRRVFLGLSLLTGMAASGSSLALAQTDLGIEAVLAQGLQHYEGGEYQAAVSTWQQASTQIQGSVTLQAALLQAFLSAGYQQLSQWSQAQAALQSGFRVLEQLEQTGQDSSGRLRILAQTLNAQGGYYFGLGQPEQALASWRESATLYEANQDLLGQLGSQLNQVLALQALGLNQQARVTLEALIEPLQKVQDRALQVTGLTSLGRAQRSLGQLEVARSTLQLAAATSESLLAADETLGIAVQLERGHTALALAQAAQDVSDWAAFATEVQMAQSAYRQVYDSTTVPLLQAQAQLHQLVIHLLKLEAADSIESHPETPDTFESLWLAVVDPVRLLLPSRPHLFARIHLVQLWLDYLEVRTPQRPQDQLLEDLLVRVITDAQTIRDRVAESYGLGVKGRWRQIQEQWQDAQRLTEQALVVAQGIQAPELSYRWQYQIAQLLQAQGDDSGSVAAYRGAYETLQVLRRDLVTVSPAIRVSFRDSVEPVYREYVDVLLREGSQLQAALEVMESLQVAELNNFFKDSCLDTTGPVSQTISLDTIDPGSAVVYPIILPDRLEVIVGIPGQPLQSFQSAVSQSDLQFSLGQLRQQLVRVIDPSSYLEVSQRIHDWLIQPMAAVLAEGSVQTLVFVLDGLFRNIPIAALYNTQQQQFLVNQYDVVIAPGLSLVDPRPWRAQPQLQALKAGLSQARQGFSELVNVPTEFDLMATAVPGIQLLDEQFTLDELLERLQKALPPVLHLATHGQFSSRADETFVLAWDQELTIETLETLIRTVDQQRRREVLELLTLSACETASGDRRAALGLAGVAVRAGARSTLASLWAVNDASTSQLMGSFYQALASAGVSKAAALRQAQLQLIETGYDHPYYWAPFVLVGNWL